jgi:HPt (histidine-containing phosphotransfer) domain-containing protein
MEPDRMTVAQKTARRPVFDPQALQALFGDAPGVIAAVLQTFSTSMADNLQQLQMARATSDAAQLLRLAHRIKGAAHMSGACALAHGAENLERAARSDGDAGNLDAGASTVRRQWVLLQRDLQFRAARDGATAL